MRRFLIFLTRQRQESWHRYATALIFVGLITGFRLVVPLDVAPFLLYLPAIFMLSVALGRAPGLVAMVASTVLAARFFVDDGTHGWQLALQQWIALLEFIIVCTAMVEVCHALRRMIFDNEEARAKLETSEARLRTIVDTVPVGIILAEAPHGRVTARNKRLDEITGSAASSQPKSMADYCKWVSFHPDGRKVEAAEYPLARVIKGEVDDAFLQVRYQRRDGSLKWIELAASATKDGNGLLTGAVVAILDIDARKLAEAAQVAMTEELRQRNEEAEAAREAAESANRAKSAFLANMSHELRTPLSAVIGYTELLEEETQAPEMLVDLGKIKSNAKHLLGLINTVLDLSKVEANKMEIFAETVDLDNFIADVVATIEPLARTKDNQLVVDVAPGIGRTLTDVVKLRQCLLNLLGNACKFTQNGKVTLRLQREANVSGDWLVFKVEDNGIGMSPDQLGRLFQRFTQADESTTRKFGGTGLGLALTRAFANLLGGDVSVLSTEGKGTCFTLKVPTNVSSGLPDVEDSGGGPIQPIMRDLVLVIDDELAQRELVTRFLRKQAFAVRTASDGRSGLELARKLKPRLILLDIMMPDMDGWSVLRTLKSDPDTANIPVVVVSFVAETNLGASLGAVETVPKPVIWARLKTLVERFRAAGSDVLVVDDDEDMRRRLRSALEKEGWSVREASDGAAALEEIGHSPPQLVLLDLMMPVMDGFSFMHRLQAMPGGSGIHVVVLSARDITLAEREQLGRAHRILRKDETNLTDLGAELRALQAADQHSAAS